MIREIKNKLYHVCEICCTVEMLIDVAVVVLMIDW